MVNVGWLGWQAHATVTFFTVFLKEDTLNIFDLMLGVFV